MSERKPCEVVAGRAVVQWAPLFPDEFMVLRFGDPGAEGTCINGEEGPGGRQADLFECLSSPTGWAFALRDTRLKRDEAGRMHAGFVASPEGVDTITDWLKGDELGAAGLDVGRSRVGGR